MSNLNQEYTKEDFELARDAMSIILECGRISLNRIQRYLKLGFNRAANSVEMLEALGLIQTVKDDKGELVSRRLIFDYAALCKWCEEKGIEIPPHTFTERELIAVTEAMLDADCVSNDIIKSTLGEETDCDAALAKLAAMGFISVNKSGLHEVCISREMLNVRKEFLK